MAWGVGGSIIARLYDSDGTTLLRTVSATHNVITQGGIGFRAFGADWHWDTVTVVPGTSPSAFAGGGRSREAQADSAVALALATASQVPAALGLNGVGRSPSVSSLAPAAAEAAILCIDHSGLSQDAIPGLASAGTARPANDNLFALALTSL